MIKTLQVRVKDKHSALLCRMAREVNTVFNFCNETSERAIREKQKFLTGFDLQKLISGYTKCDGVEIGSGTIDLVCAEYATRRKQFKKNRLNWRVSNKNHSKYSLGWVPFKAREVKYRSGQIRFAGHLFSLWDSYDLSAHELHAGSFSQDARGRWYFNVSVEIEAQRSEGSGVIGIDLGLKTAVTTSDGKTFEGRRFRVLEEALSTAKRANKKRRAANRSKRWTTSPTAWPTCCGAGCARLTAKQSSAPSRKSCATSTPRPAPGRNKNERSHLQQRVSGTARRV